MAATYPHIRLPQKEEPQLFRESEPGNFDLPDDLLLMIGSTKNSSKTTTKESATTTRQPVS